jgi:hypothetical protein
MNKASLLQLITNPFLVKVGHKLMLALGYQEYGEHQFSRPNMIADAHPAVTQGDDWGFPVGVL